MKKWICFVLSVVMVAALNCTALSAVNAKVADVNDDYFISRDPQDYANANARLDGKTVGDITALQVKGGSELRILLRPELFVDGDGTPLSELGIKNTTATMLRSGKIAVKRQVTANGQAMDSIKLEYNKNESNAYIAVKFVEHYVSTKEVDFDYEIYLTASGSRTNAGFRVSGTIANPVVDVEAYEDYLDLSRGIVAEAKAYVKNIRLDLGEDVSLTTNLFEGNKYYGTATIDTVSLSSHPSVTAVYTLRTVGLKREGNIVTIKTDGTRYVYDAEGVYMGTTNTKLPYSTKYYVSDKQYESINVPK